MTVGGNADWSRDNTGSLNGWQPMIDLCAVGLMIFAILVSTNAHSENAATRAAAAPSEGLTPSFRKAGLKAITAIQLIPRKSTPYTTSEFARTLRVHEVEIHMVDAIAEAYSEVDQQALLSLKRYWSASEFGAAGTTADLALCQQEVATMFRTGAFVAARDCDKIPILNQ